MSTTVTRPAPREALDRAQTLMEGIAAARRLRARGVIRFPGDAATAATTTGAAAATVLAVRRAHRKQGALVPVPPQLLAHACEAAAQVLGGVTADELKHTEYRMRAHTLGRELVVEYLRDAGYTDLAIAATGISKNASLTLQRLARDLATDPTIKAYQARFRALLPALQP